MFKFAVIPNDVPSYVEKELYDKLWEYWTNNCNKEFKKEFSSAHKKISKKQKGWVSVADMEDAGFTEWRTKIVPLETSNRILNEILREHCPC